MKLITQQMSLVLISSFFSLFYMVSFLGCQMKARALYYLMSLSLFKGVSFSHRHK